eukprot:CAMPEP_0173443592 /NCGR_PEP_ID=MMETSP1357-20121228/30213_1 /TAXON_ID=77926 /ORGANISM="Hemiselmis rufescens, Strain PCC563" /LENGTH=273 /DNA_ID=CAMNT_0014409513 /DNA_START=138 /DNA_END=955 /DNA_ORIENTATION=+
MPRSNAPPSHQPGGGDGAAGTPPPKAAAATAALQTAPSPDKPRGVVLCVGGHLWALAVEEFDELLVCSARLGPRKPPVFVEDRSHAPVVHGTETADQTAGSVLALVAVDEHRVVPHVEEPLQRGPDDFIRDVHKGLLVAAHAVREDGDVHGVVELLDLARVVLLTEVNDALQAKLPEEAEVLLGGVGAAVDPAVDHREVLGGVQLVPPVPVLHGGVCRPLERVDHQDVLDALLQHQPPLALQQLPLVLQQRVRRHAVLLAPAAPPLPVPRGVR